MCSGRQEIFEFFASQGHLFKRLKGVTDHGLGVKAVRRLIHYDKSFSEVGIQLEQVVQFLLVPCLISNVACGGNTKVLGSVSCIIR